MKMTRALVLLLVFMSVSGCSWLGLSDDGKKEDQAEKDEKELKKETDKAKKKVPICPQVAIVRDLEEMKDYGTETPAPDQLVAEARLKGVTGDCGYEDNGIDIKFEISMASKKGPRLGGNHVSFPFFIAVVDPNQTIVTKEPMTADFKFSGDNQVAERSENLHVYIPLAKTDQPTGPHYRVLLGYQIPAAAP